MINYKILLGQNKKLLFSWYTLYSNNSNEKKKYNRNGQGQHFRLK